jgi:hypothetical protein
MRKSWTHVALRNVLGLLAFSVFETTVFCFAAPGDDSSQKSKAPERCVRVIYMVSKDREVKREYVQAIEKAARSVQTWYAVQLGGRTFRLHDPVVEVVKSDKEAKWFTENPNKSLKDNWGFLNTLAETKRLCDFERNRERFLYVVYSDGPGNKGRAMPGFVYLPEDDLLGLLGKHPRQKDPRRWVGGLAHELGHGLGLKHPEDTKKHYSAIMWAGFYGKYPKGAYLTDEDKNILSESPLIQAVNEDSTEKKPREQPQ